MASTGQIGVFSSQAINGWDSPYGWIWVRETSPLRLPLQIQAAAKFLENLQLHFCSSKVNTKGLPGQQLILCTLNTLPIPIPGLPDQQSTLSSFSRVFIHCHSLIQTPDLQRDNPPIFGVHLFSVYQGKLPIKKWMLKLNFVVICG